MDQCGGSGGQSESGRILDKFELTGLSNGLVWGMGAVKDASKVFALSNWKNGVLLRKGRKITRGTKERVRHVLLLKKKCFY